MLAVYDNNGQLDGRALVAFEAAEDAAFAQESAEGLKMGNNALTVRTAMVPRLNKARPMVVVDNLVDTESDTQRELWDALEPIGTIQRMTTGARDAAAWLILFRSSPAQAPLGKSSLSSSRTHRRRHSPSRGMLWSL